MLPPLVGSNVLLRHGEFSDLLLVAVVRTNVCHLLPPQVDIDLLSFELLGHISEVVLYPLLLVIYLIKFLLLRGDSLVPNRNRIELRLWGFILTNN